MVTHSNLECTCPARGSVSLNLQPSNGSPPGQPEAHGRLLSATEVATELLQGAVSAAWVRRTVPHKIRLGHSTVVWRESDVLNFIASQREP